MSDEASIIMYEKMSRFLQSFESYIAETARTNHGAKSGEVTSTFKAKFDQAMLASAEYHEEVAEIYRGDGDNAMSGFHQLQAQIYRSVISK